MTDIWDPNYQQRSPILQQFSIATPRLVQWPSIDDLNSVSGQRFVAHDQLEGNYELMIFETGTIPTREQNWHDFFNAQVWFNFPKTKALLNRLQYQEITRRTVKQRTALENALTLFDENGAVVLCSEPELLQLLREHQWKALFLERREQVLENMRVVVFGHSLHEKALNPYVGMTAHCLLFDLNETTDLDAMLCSYLSQHQIAPKALQPLPILGYPGWHFAEQDEAFYDNSQYFRAKR